MTINKFCLILSIFVSQSMAMLADLTSTDCMDPSTGKIGHCTGGKCVRAEVAANLEAGEIHDFCVCGPLHSGSGCHEWINHEVNAYGDAVIFGSETGHDPYYLEDNLVLIWEPSMSGKTFNYPARSLIGLYLVTSIDECKAQCERMNLHKRKDDGSFAYHNCGAVITHEHEGDDAQLVCELVATKPVRSCKKWLTDRSGWQVDYLAPIHNKYGCN